MFVTHQTLKYNSHMYIKVLTVNLTIIARKSYKFLDLV
jgi:hypothetical protein